jgi:hypothetical protein
MSMNIGGNGQKAQINVTPMIDVLLVLIIIFMVITPIAPRGLNAVVPPQADTPPPPGVIPRDIVISVAKNGAIEINQQPGLPGGGGGHRHGTRRRLGAGRPDDALNRSPPVKPRSHRTSRQTLSGVI